MEIKENSQLQKTPFYQKHLDNRARIINFFGWALPLEYSGILKETKAARQSCVLFDVSHMGQISIVGPKAKEFLQRLASNDISKISPSQLQYNLLLTDNASIIDDCMVYNRGEDLLCVVNALNKDKVLKWLNKNADQRIKIVDESEKTALLSLQGPNSENLLSKIFGDSILQICYMNFAVYSMENLPCLISRSGYTGEDGFEIYCDPKYAIDLWDALIEAGKEYSLKLAGLGSRDILRIEAGYSLYGNEIDEMTTPLEACLGWALKLNKEKFLGKERLLKQKEEGIKKKRIGFIMQDKGLARSGYAIFNEDGSRKIGKVTSGSYSPNLNAFIGMAYIDTAFTGLDTVFNVEIRKRLCKARVAKFPFITSRIKKNDKVKT